MTNALLRERLDASILRSFGGRRALRTIRTTTPSSEWDCLERHVTRTATVLWEIALKPVDARDDLLAYCAFLAREIELTESLDLNADLEWKRLQDLAPRALVALDELVGELTTDGWPVDTTHALACALAGIRAELTAAMTLSWSLAA